MVSARTLGGEFVPPGTKVPLAWDPPAPGGDPVAGYRAYRDGGLVAFTGLSRVLDAWGEDGSEGNAGQDEGYGNLRRLQPAPSHLYRLDPDTLKRRRIDPARTNVFLPTPPALRGTYGRFRYMPCYNAYVPVNHGEDDVFFYKIGPWTSGDTPPPAPGGLMGSSEELGGVRLSWPPVEDPDGGRLTT